MMSVEKKRPLGNLGQGRGNGLIRKKVPMERKKGKKEHRRQP